MIRALLLALALAGCEGQVRESPAVPEDWYPLKHTYEAFARMDSIAQADTSRPRGTVLWPAWPPAGSDAGFVHPDSAIAQADPTTEADWPWLAQPCSLTVKNDTQHTLLLEQAHVVTLAKPGDSLTVELGGLVTIREEGSYDE